MQRAKVEFGRLESVDLRKAWDRESTDFTPWLAQSDNIRLLGEAIGIELEVEAQEKNVGPFRADILCKDLANGNWVLVENQLERTDHCHLGQLITYAAGLHAVTIVWIAARFTDEHRAALDWLNEVTGDQILFFGLEVELWRIGNSSVAPKFNVISSPNDWTKSVADARNAIETGGLSESRQLYLSFWTFFADRIRECRPGIRAPKPNADSWKTFAVGRTGFVVAPSVVARDSSISVQLWIQGERSKQRFRLLEARKTQIETALGSAIEWRELPDQKDSMVRLVHSEMDVKDRDQWPAIADWLIEWTEKFQVVFRPLVKEIDAEDVAPTETR